MAEEMSPEMVAEARRIVDDIFENLIRRHEIDDHDGEPCLPGRIGTVAYIAHVIGIRPSVDNLTEIGVAMFEYEQSHDDHHQHNGHG